MQKITDEILYTRLKIINSSAQRRLWLNLREIPSTYVWLNPIERARGEWMKDELAKQAGAISD